MDPTNPAQLADEQGHVLLLERLIEQPEPARRRWLEAQVTDAILVDEIWRMVDQDDEGFHVDPKPGARQQGEPVRLGTDARGNLEGVTEMSLRILKEEEVLTSKDVLCTAETVKARGVWSRRKVAVWGMALLVSLLTVATVRANNVQVTNVALVDRDLSGTPHYTHIELDISWESSWRTSSAPSNWDAAWVFAKFRNPATTGDWAHCTLSTSGATAPTGSTIQVPDDGGGAGVGALIYRSADGTGTNSWTDARLRWNYGSDGVGDGDMVDVRVFAIEMVYVPQGDYALGDTNSNNRFHDGDSTSEVYQVTSSQIEFGTGDGQLWATGAWDSPTGSLQTAYPTGWGAFYVMKYEVSQEQYADFLNTLTAAQEGPRYYSGSTSRYTIGGSQGSRTAGAPNRACNYLSWADGAAYADWAGLRPMTELEYEKAARGEVGAVAGEYAWGNASIAGTSYAPLQNDGQPNATVSNYATTPTGNAMYWTTSGSGTIDGPLRCGIFATASSDRIEAGAGYYGAMELSGNLWERAVTLGNATGRAFTGVHGDGALDGTGNADVANWPGTDASGAGFRGGSWYNLVRYLRVSDRADAAYTNAGRVGAYGFRCVRSEP